MVKLGKEHKKHPSIISNYETWETLTLDPHEPIGGKNRPLSIKEGLYIYIDRKKHRWIHDTEEGQLYNDKLKQQMQETWMEYNHKSEKDFIKLFGRNYL